MRRGIPFPLFALLVLASGCSQENSPRSVTSTKSSSLTVKVPETTPMTATPLINRWHFFASKGPEYSLPIRRCWVQEGISSFIGTLHIGLYPKKDFSDLIDFNLYQWYSSSIQQDLIQTGKLDRNSFFPEMEEEGVSRFESQLEELQKRKNGGDIRKILLDLHLPNQAGWVHELDYEEWEVTMHKGSLELTASTKQGYLTMFIVDDK